MLRLLSNSLILVTSLTAAAFAYQFILKVFPPDRYDLFDLLKGTPVPPAVVDPETRNNLLGQADTKPVAKPLPPVDLADLQLLERVNTALSDLADSVVPGVVSINTTTTTERLVPVDPFGFFGYRRSDQKTPGLGSGLIVSEEGHILTNHHVVAGVDEIEVTTHGGGIYRAEWVGSDASVDIAVLKMQPINDETPLPKFPVLKFGDSDEVRTGETVLAIGNPFGLSETITKGIISAKQRRLSDDDNEYFQVDAVINPGNSGGPLINVRGEVIGVNVAIFTGQRNVQVWQGIGLAIPSNEARDVFNAIVLKKPLIRGYLGLQLTDLSPRLALGLGLRSTRGALVREVTKGSPAAKAGLLPGDIILKFDGRDANTADETLSRIRRKKTGDRVAITVLRQGKLKQMAADIAERPDRGSLTLRSDITENGQAIADELGITVKNLAPQQRTAMGLHPKSPGIFISDVKPGSQAAKRFAPGDLIHMINRDPVTSVEVFYDLLGTLPRNQPSVMVLSRDGHRIQAVLNP
ncbi:MAG: PDZ domain-containing protein [Verrucomicrobiales bacterium]|nr:PDZ domain-containing protein [Verrucomicrobiales bacterium]